MPIIESSGPGTAFTNNTSKILWQFKCQWRNSCGVCIQFSNRVGTYWPIPLHVGCNCVQVAIRPGETADPYLDFQAEIHNLLPRERARVVGVSNWTLIDKGLVEWEDVVTRARVRDFREVVAEQKLSVKALVRAGVSRGVAERAHAAISTPAHGAAESEKSTLVRALRGHGLSDAQIQKELSVRLAARVGVRRGPELPERPSLVGPYGPTGPQGHPGGPAGPGGPGRPVPGPGGPQGPTGPRRAKPKAKPRATPKPKAKPVAVEPVAAPAAVEPVAAPAAVAGSGPALLDRARRLNVRIAPASPLPVSDEDLRAVLVELEKLPSRLHDVIASVGSGMEVLSGRGITDLPRLAMMKGVTPRGWPAGKTWDDVPGAGAARLGDATVIVANSLRRGHGSLNLVIHEHAHTFDYSHQSPKLGFANLSSRDDWRQIHKAATWDSSYHRNYPEEGFAYAFERYYHSPETRASMDPAVRSYVEKLMS